MILDTELILIVGAVLCVLSVPSALSAFSEERWPRAGGCMLIVGGGLIIWAVALHPDRHSVKEIPEIFMRVLARYVL